MIIIYILAGLIVTLLLVAALMPKSYNVEKSIIIKKPATAVKKNIIDLNAYAAWNPWQQMDPGSSRKVSGSPGMAGHKYEWQGKKIGMGSLTLKDSDDKHAHIDLEFIKPWKSLANDNWLFEPWGDGTETKVTWQNTGNLPWPMARLMYPMINRNLNKQFDIGLNNLKKMCEGA